MRPLLRITGPFEARFSAPLLTALTITVIAVTLFLPTFPGEATAQIDGPDLSPTPPAPDTAAALHVHNLVPQAEDLPDGKWRARVTVKVRDQDELPFGGVTVTGDFAGVERSCVTDMVHGQCSVSREQGDALPQPRFVVKSLIGEGRYVPRANHDAAGKDSDGTAVRVYQPLDDDPKHIVIEQDTMVTSGMVLRPGDTVEFRNGARLSFAAGGFADWRGTPTTTWSRNGRVQNLDRNVRIFGDGDIRFEGGSRKSTIRFVEIDLQPTPELGRYPLHWHHAGEGSRGTVVTGVVVKNSTNRGIVPHASHGITFRDVIVKDTVLEAFWWDPPCACDGVDFPRFHTSNNSNDIRVHRLLVDGVSPSEGDPGHALGGVVLGAGKGNVIRNSVVMNVNGGKNSSGYHWPSTANLNDGGNDWVFVGNRAHHVQHGIYMWQNDGSLQVIRQFGAWKVRGAGVSHGAYSNRSRYVDMDIHELRVYAPGALQIRRGSINKVVIGHHVLSGSARFSGTDIRRVVVDNGGGKAPGTLLFARDTGLTCDDVRVHSVFPGTVVKVGGKRCALLRRR